MLSIVVSVRMSSFSPGCYGEATICHCGTTWAFHITFSHMEHPWET